MKKIIPIFLLLMFLFETQNANAFWWNNKSEEKIHPSETMRIWSNPFFSSYHNFFNNWSNDFWNFSFPQSYIRNNYPLDLEEQENLLIATIDVPFFKLEDITVEIKNDRWLLVSGKKESENSTEKNEKKYHYQERSAQSFSRQILLPSAVDKSQTAASLKDGILRISMPKKDEAAVSSDIIPITTQ